MSAEIELINDEYLSVKFQFNQNLVNQIRNLHSRRWNPQKKRWEVHIAHLAELMRIFYLHPDEIPPKIVQIYQQEWIRTQLHVKITHTTTMISGKRIPIDKIDDALSFPVMGHQYSPKFLDGSWDGKKHLFDKRDFSFPTGLLDRVMNIIDKEGVEYQIIDNRKKSKASVKVKKSDIELRDYQIEAIEKSIEAKRGILEMATGAGKTTVAAALIYELSRTTMFFVHTKDLLYQAKNYFEEHLKTKIGQIGDGKIDIKPITVATIQTAIKAFDGTYTKVDEEDEEDTTDISGKKDEIKKAIGKAEVVFFDECHHIPAETCYSVAMQTNSAGYRFGLSATPYRADRQDMLIEASIGRKTFSANASFLIDKGHLVPPQILILDVPSGKAAKKDEYQKIYNSQIVENDKRNKLIIKQAKSLNKVGMSVLILVSQVKHGKIIKSKFPDAQFVQGNDSAKVRMKALNDLKNKKILTLIATTLADEGLDLPSLNAVILAGGGKSETKALQRIGRALRVSEGKDTGYIFDFNDSAPYIKEHSKRRIEIYKTEPLFKVLTGKNALKAAEKAVKKGKETAAKKKTVAKAEEKKKVTKKKTADKKTVTKKAVAKKTVTKKKVTKKAVAEKKVTKKTAAKKKVAKKAVAKKTTKKKVTKKKTAKGKK